uniref:Putative hexamethylene bis-acetamide inducible 1 n=1 Tax=Amblyomma cajennense TaxID=34607 RepID=A0A023FP63_AMBCJ
MIASIASAPSLSANGSADPPMTLDRDITVAPEPAGSEALLVGKHRKRRRGKKRRQGRDDPDAVLSSSDAASPTKRSPTKRRKKQVMIRPREVPKAPANFTQFIIDDHENCALYQSFEAAYPNGHSDEADGCRPTDLPTMPLGVSQTDESGEEEPQSWFPAGEHYESLDYGNMMEFYEKDFEEVYSSARMDELMRLSRCEVVEMYTALERRAAELYDELHKLDPQNCLDELQRQLLRLQDENQALLKLNSTLRSAATSSLTTSSSSSGHDADDSDHCGDQRDEEDSDNDESDDSGHEEDSGDDEGVVQGVDEDCRP